jgi:hypothetical protein
LQAGYPQVPKIRQLPDASIGSGSNETQKGGGGFSLTLFPVPKHLAYQGSNLKHGVNMDTEVRTSSLDSPEITQLADQGMLFVGCRMGMSSSRWLDWQDRGTSDKPTLLDWVNDGNSLVTVAKRDHSFVGDIDDLAACERLGFKREWLDGYYAVETPSGGEHHHGLHDATTETLGNLIVVYRVRGDKESGKILELKLHNQSVAAPTAKRYADEKKCAGVYEPRKRGAKMRRGIHPEMLAWLEEHGEPSKPHDNSSASLIDFHPQFDRERFLEQHDCTEDNSGIVDGALHVVVESGPLCGKEARNSTVAAGITKFIFSGYSFGFVCHACAVNSKQELEEELAELVEGFKPWNEFIYEGDDPELLLRCFGAEEVSLQDDIEEVAAQLPSRNRRKQPKTEILNLDGETLTDRRTGRGSELLVADRRRTGRGSPWEAKVQERRRQSGGKTPAPAHC